MKTLPLKVIVIDDDKNMHAKYQGFFFDSEEYELLGIYDSIGETLLHYRKRTPNIILSEVSLPGISGILGIEQLRKKDASVKIIMISTKSDFDLVKKAFKNGANGYLTKPITRARLFHALNSVKQDGAALSYDVAKKLISTFQKKRYMLLSKRENQIVDYLSQGATYKSIAEKLFVTTSTVNFHIQNIYLKLNVNSKSEALEKLRLLDTNQRKYA